MSLLASPLTSALAAGVVALFCLGGLALLVAS